jgi:predicted CXXCH cytochrome family protein
MIPSRARVRRVKAASLTVMVLLCLGCSAATRRNVASYIFDGVPAPPLPEEYCASWLAAKQEQGGQAKKEVKEQGSVHRPYKEKKCKDCHDTSKSGGLIAPPRTLCLLCHGNIVKGAYGHAPAVSGDCLACHLPHDSVFPYLLKKEKDKICVSCHIEQRMAQGLHDRVAKAGILCYDCHNPHAGNVKYFLK